MQHRGAPVLHARLFQACACNISCENTMIGAFEEACQQLAVHLCRRTVRREKLVYNCRLRDTCPHAGENVHATPVCAPQSAVY